MRVYVICEKSFKNQQLAQNLKNSLTIFGHTPYLPQGDTMFLGHPKKEKVLLDNGQAFMNRMGWISIGLNHDTAQFAVIAELAYRSFLLWCQIQWNRL